MIVNPLNCHERVAELERELLAATEVRDAALALKANNPVKFIADLVHHRVSAFCGHDLFYSPFGTADSYVSFSSELVSELGVNGAEEFVRSNNMLDKISELGKKQ